MQTAATEIQYRFRQHREELRELFVDDLAKSQQLELDWHSYLRHLFEQIEAIVELKEVAAFQRYLENEDNLPAHISASSLRFDDFEELLELWLDYRKLSVANMAESFYISEDQHNERKECRNPAFREVLHAQQRLLAQFSGGSHNKKKLSEQQLLELMHRLFRELVVYEKDSDRQEFVDKANFASVARQVVRRYLYLPERELKPFDQRQLMGLSELPRLLQFWESTNPELKAESSRRRTTTEVSVQTEGYASNSQRRVMNTGMQTVGSSSIVSKTTLPHHLAPPRHQGNTGGIEATLNTAIQNLKFQREHLLNADQMQSVDFLLIALQRQRRRMFPGHRYKLHHPELTSNEDRSREEITLDEFNDYLQEIYEHYRKNPAKIIENPQNISFLGDYAEEVIEQQRKSEPLSYADYRKFVQEIEDFTGLKLAESMLQSNRLSRSVANHLTLDTFTTMVRELMVMSPQLREWSLARFVREKIRGQDKTISTKKGIVLKDPPKRKANTPLSNSPKKRKGSTDNATQLLAPAHTLLLYTGRDDQQPEIRKKKSQNSPGLAYRRRSSKNAGACNSNQVCFRKKEPFSPYREPLAFNGLARQSIESNGGIFRKKTRINWPRDFQS